jgi:hypothetical protein
MKRWVGLGVIADNLINIGRAMEKRSPIRSCALNLNLRYCQNYAGNPRRVLLCDQYLTTLPKTSILRWKVARGFEIPMTKLRTGSHFNSDAVP